MRELWARAFMVISTRRSQQGRVSRFRIGQLSNFSGLWGTRLSLVVWYLALGGDLGRQTVVQCVRAP